MAWIGCDVGVEWCDGMHWGMDVMAWIECDVGVEWCDGMHWGMDTGWLLLPVGKGGVRNTFFFHIKV
eukprot:1159684-Pelagomonas_calceolata.AAC.1